MIVHEKKIAALLIFFQFRKTIHFILNKSKFLFLLVNYFKEVFNTLTKADIHEHANLFFKLIWIP